MTSITNAYARVDSVFDQAQSFIDQLADLAQDDTIGLGTDWVLLPWAKELRDEVAIPEAAVLDTATLTSLDDLAVDAKINIPTPITSVANYYTSILPAIWALGTIDEFTEIAPTVVAPIAPIPGTFTIPDAHIVSDIAIPDWKSKELPTEVVLFETPIDALDVLEIGDIALTAPGMNLVLPANSFSYEEQTYSSELLTSLQILLSSDIEDGGYGINPDDEQKLYTRAREREVKQAATAVNQARKGIAARGFPVPPGSLYATERVILSQGAVSLAELNREIVLKRSDLYVAARQFAVQQGLNLEEALITYTGAKQERALKAAQIAAELIIQFHNAAVQLFELRISIKQLELDIHKDQLATAAAKLQEYGQRLAYADMTDKRNQVRLQLYNQQLEAVKVFYQAQAVEADLIKLTVDIERLKLQANQDRVTIYETEVRAKADEYDLFRTAWQAEETKQKVFAQQLAAHDQQIETVVKESKMRQDQFEAKINLIKVQRERQAMALEQYGVVLRKATLDADVGKQMNQEQLDMWKINRSTGQFNVETSFRQKVEHAAKLLEAQQSNINQMQVAVSNVLKLKDLNGASAEAALLLYGEGVKGAASSLTLIETIAGS